MALNVYNSLTRKKEPFVPLVPNHVGMYVCGPTVSGESHLGHARPFITFDFVYRYLLHLGYKVRYVRNITDAGHFEEEGRKAEDKIDTKAKLEKMEPMELVQKYSNLFHLAMARFNNLPPSIEPTATGHIIEQITMIEKIIKAGYAYITNGSVYFDVEKYHTDFSKKGMPYGMLSGRILDQQLETTRDLDNQDEKRNKFDFALWKNASPEHIMQWPSPWGMGFPGWHIECSAMSTKYLGSQFDIHGGGMDLRFPHHECEIAQSSVCNHEVPARYWLHNNMITINGKKMGKSYNNIIKLSDLFSGTDALLSQPYSPMTIRFFILQTHYRSTLDFSNEALEAAERGFHRLWDAYETLGKLKANQKSASDIELAGRIRNKLAQFSEFMDDDFNTAKVLASMFDIVPIINAVKNQQLNADAIGDDLLAEMKETFKDFVEDVFGLTNENRQSDKIEGVLNILIELRGQAKKEKNYVLSDKIRNDLASIGIILKDEKGGGSSYTLL